VVAAIAAVLGSAAAEPAPAADAADAGERARRILESGEYQTALPVDPAALPLPGVPLQALVWVGLLVGVSVVVWLLARELGFGDRGRVDADATAESGAAADLDRMLEDAERLAREGRFDAAVHALLLAAIRSLSIETGRVPPDSSTARELLRTFPLEGERRSGFAALVRAVEWTMFGGRSIGADEYGRCRETFATVVAR